jgi:hypothetical protein
MSPHRKPAVFCRCGAAWFGAAAVENPVIAAHRDRCGPSLSGAAYERLGYHITWPQGWTAGERRHVRDGRELAPARRTMRGPVRLKSHI